MPRKIHRTEYYAFEMQARELQNFPLDVAWEQIILPSGEVRHYVRTEPGEGGIITNFALYDERIAPDVNVTLIIPAPRLRMRMRMLAMPLVLAWGRRVHANRL